MNRLLLVLIAIFILGTGAALADLHGLEANIPLRRIDDDARPVATSHDTGWRRTTHGWEHQSAWQARPGNVAPSPFQRISPVIVGLLQLFTAGGVLALFDRRA